MIIQKFVNARKLVLIMPLLLTSCGTYSGKFNCPDAKGAQCQMLSSIDAQVSSGEIEKIYQDQGKKCLFGRCGSRSEVLNNKPLLANQELIRAKINKSSEIEQESYLQDEYLYVK